MTLLLLDSADPSQFAGLHFDALAGYVGGSYPDFSRECQMYPSLQARHRIASIAVNADENADFLDIERGDASPGDAVPWLHRQHARGVWRPGVYASLSTWQAGLYDAVAYFQDTIRRWYAAWNYRTDIAHGFDAHQYIGSPPAYHGHNVDLSICLDNFFPGAPQPPVINHTHYERFDTGPFSSSRWGKLNERLVVEQYDGARQHPQKYDAYLKHVLELKLKFLAERVAYVALKDHPVSWDKYYRGWRYQQLLRRSQGQRFV